MRKLATPLAAAGILAATATLALAIDPEPNSEEPAIQRIIETPPADETTGAIPRVKLEAGKNSFTENQARSRIKAAGFTNVSALALDEQGIWRGSARKGEMEVRVGLDFKGNIAAESAQ